MPSTFDQNPRVDLSSYSSDGYDPGNFFVRCIWLLFSRAFFETRFPWPSRFKSCFLRIFGAKIGARPVIRPNVKIKYPWRLQIGDHCWIGEKVWIDNLAEVVIEDHVVISQGAYLLTGNHDYSSPVFALKIDPITIETGSWIAAKAIVCPGSTVSRNAVLCVGSVAKGSLEESGIYSGNPAKRIRERTIRPQE